MGDNALMVHYFSIVHSIFTKKLLDSLSLNLKLMDGLLFSHNFHLLIFPLSGILIMYKCMDLFLYICSAGTRFFAAMCQLPIIFYLLTMHFAGTVHNMSKKICSLLYYFFLFVPLWSSIY